MATTEAAVYAVAGKDCAKPDARGGAWISAALTLAVIAIHGYHPYAEDGGVYLAGVKHLLHPQLYPTWTGFVTAHLKFSLFAPMIAALVRITRLNLMTAMLLIYAASIWLTLFSAWMLASRCYSGRGARLGAVTMLALTLTIPVAGTSLMLMDPYVTARSISTPCGILMLVGTLDLCTALAEHRTPAWRSVILLACSFAGALAVHPLMAAYALACALLLAGLSLRSRQARIAAICGMCLLAIASAACIARMSSPNMPDYVLVARTRTYWFLSDWQWYEVVGLIGPIVVLLALTRYVSVREAQVGKWLAAMAAVAGVTSTLVALLFAEVSSRAYAVAKLQPLRIFQMIYVLMLLALGAVVAEHLLKRSVVRWAAMFVVIGGAMFLVQRQTFPHTAHLEFPWRATDNPWRQGFEWIRMHTPEDAVFALDANYISADGEDSQNFRAIAERSVLPDYAKDGGIASIAPALTSQWMAGEAAQQNLSRSLGAREIARLQTYHVDYVVLLAQTPASIACRYANPAVKVCQLP